MKHMKVKCSVLTGVNYDFKKPIYLKFDLFMQKFGNIGFSIIPSIIDKDSKRYNDLFNKFKDSQCNYILSTYDENELSKFKKLISTKCKVDVNTIMFDEYVNENSFMYDIYVNNIKLAVAEGFPPYDRNNKVDGFKFDVTHTFYIIPKDSFFESIYGKSWRHDKSNIKQEEARHFLYNDELLELQRNIDGSLPNHLYLKDNQILYFHI